jgi:hypothetical protein
MKIARGAFSKKIDLLPTIKIARGAFSKRINLPAHSADSGGTVPIMSRI